VAFTAFLWNIKTNEPDETPILLDTITLSSVQELM
jgi:hypothetical protein